LAVRADRKWVDLITPEPADFDTAEVTQRVSVAILQMNYLFVCSEGDRVGRG
jgi:hypothetical protein